MISRIHSWSYNGNRRYFLQIYVNSLFPGTAMLWNYMPIECFPLTFDLNGFKSRINKIESHLRTTAVPILEIKRCVRYKKKGHFGSSEGSVRRHWRPCFTAVDNANSTGGLKGHSVPPSKGLGGKTAISYKRKKFFIRIPEMSHFSSKFLFWLKNHILSIKIEGLRAILTFAQIRQAHMIDNTLVYAILD